MALVTFFSVLQKTAGTIVAVVFRLEDNSIFAIIFLNENRAKCNKK